MDFLFAILPIAVLVFAMTKARPMSAKAAFLLSAVLLYGVRYFYFGDRFWKLNAAVLGGMLDALTPVAILLGAIVFFVAMEKSGAMLELQSWLRGVSPNPVAQIMLAGWAFIFLIEGAAGFGTPAALAAPMLVALGFPAVRTAIVCIVFNTISTPFGAVGTPLWFGFEALGLSQEEMLGLSSRVALLQMVAGFVVTPFALRLLVSWREIGKDWLFILLSIMSCVLPMFLVAKVSYEFPAVVGGAIGLGTTALLATYGIGLGGEEGGPLLTRKMVWSSLPLVVTVFILLITRIPALGLRQWLTASEPHWDVSLGMLGELMVSPTAVVSLRGILGEERTWTHAILYVPSIVPFVLTAGLALAMGGKGVRFWRDTVVETRRRVGSPVLALFGALAFVSLLTAGGAGSSADLLGRSMAGWAGGSWKFFAPLLGALGSFFSGSTTISNLTFGAIQASIAGDLGVARSGFLVLQCSGAAMGNIVCIHNIVSVCAVLALTGVEGLILKKSLPLLAVFAVFLMIAAAFF